MKRELIVELFENASISASDHFADVGKMVATWKQFPNVGFQIMPLSRCNYF